jgi:hypothetical protein
MELYATRMGSVVGFATIMAVAAKGTTIFWDIKPSKQGKVPLVLN